MVRKWRDIGEHFQQHTMSYVEHKHLVALENFHTCEFSIKHEHLLNIWLFKINVKSEEQELSYV